MSIREALRLEALERLVAELQARVTALEAQRADAAAMQTPAHARPNPLRKLNASRQTRCNRLRAEIASVLARASDLDSITAKDVAQALASAGIEPMPSDRTVRLRLAEARAEMATRGNTGNCQKTA